MKGAVIQKGSCIINSIIGWKCKIGPWAHLNSLTVLGEDVTVKEMCILSGVKVCTHKSIDKSILQPQNII